MALALALILPPSPLGLAPLAGALLVLISGQVLAYLALAEAMKCRALRKPG